MIIRKFFFITISFFLFQWPIFLKADFSLYWRDNNYFLFEARGYHSLDLNRDAAATSVANERLYSTFKLRMRPSLGITDRLSIHSTFDAFVSPHTTTSQEEGTIAGQQTTDTNNYGPDEVDATIPKDLFGSVSGFGRSGVTTGDSNFLVRTTFLEYIGDWGILRLGRQPRHWGLGIRYHSGEDPRDKFSDRTDTISYELGLGSFKVAAMVSKILENNFDSSKDDVNTYEGYVHWNDPEKDLDVGFLYSLFVHRANYAYLNYFDTYFKKRAKKWETGLEVIAGTGNPGTAKDNDTFQLGIASELSYNWLDSLRCYMKAGYASGADLDRKGKLTLFAFHRNYDVALIMFNQGVGAIRTQTGVDATSNPDVNAIFGAYYLNMGGDYIFNDRIGTGLGYTIAEAPLALTPGGKKDYGQELDLSMWYQFVENLKLKLEGGVFFPGKLYRGVPRQSPPRSIDTSFALLGSTVLVF